MRWWRRNRRRNEGEWQDLEEAWDESWPRRDAAADEPDDWEGDEDWDDYDAEDDEGWDDPEPERRPSLLGRLILLPFRLLLFPFKVAFWFVALSLAWVAAYAVVNPPLWTHLEAERARLGQAVHFWQDLDEISPHLVRAAMAAEDARFCEHWGIDLDATRAALEQTLEGERLIGGSTISQQAAKNVFLWHDRSWLRKGLEAGFTLAMEAIWGKRRIMEVYLNVAEFDAGTFGAEAAARGYFGVPASRLTLEQAARLAAVLPDPKGRDAARPGDFTRRRAAEIADGARTLERTGRDACVLD